MESPTKTCNLENAILEGMRLKITFERDINRGEADFLPLFEQLKRINLRDKKKRSVRRKVSKNKKDKVKKTIDFNNVSESEIGVEQFRVCLSNIIVSIARKDNEIFVFIQSSISGYKLEFPLCRWKTLQAYKSEITAGFSRQPGDQFRKHLGGGLYAEVDTGKFLAILYF